jgi:uncharacterized protein
MNVCRAAQTAVAAALLAAACIALASAQSPPSVSALRKEQVPAKQSTLPENQYTVGIVTGEPQSTDFTIAYDIATTLAKGQETGPHGEMALRVMAMVGTGGTRNISDVLTLPGADMAIVPVIVLNRLRATKEIGDLGSKLVYVTLLFPEEIHVLARAEIQDIADLAGQAVNFGQEGGAAEVFGREILGRLGIKVREVNVDLNAAVDGMRTGQISATLLVSGKPVKSLASYSKGDGLHFVAIPYSPALYQDYLPTALKHEDYPGLIGVDENIETIAAGSALMAYNWPPRSERFRLLELFARTLFSRIDEFKTEPHHPKWRELNLAAALPGWRRFPPAERWLAQHAPAEAELRRQFERFLSQGGITNSVGNDRERIFQDFLRWLKRSNEH